MFWPEWKYKDYVEKNASRHDVDELLDPWPEEVDENVPKVLVTFYPMPLWMGWYDLAPDDHAFRLFVHRYRSEIKQYKAALRLQFKPIPCSWTGKALLKELGRTKRVVKFRPYWRWDDPINADAIPKNRTHPEQDDFINSTARAARVRFHRRTHFGTGVGTNSIIGYSPGMWGTGYPQLPHGPGTDPDETIFHELVHASRQMSGTVDHTKVNAGYDNVDEYLAIVLTNIYMSERGKTVLLGDHDDAQLKHNETFLDNVQHVDLPPRELILKFAAAQPEFYVDLTLIGPAIASFNPVRQFSQGPL